MGHVAQRRGAQAQRQLAAPGAQPMLAGGLEGGAAHDRAAAAHGVGSLRRGQPEPAVARLHTVPGVLAGGDEDGAHGGLLVENRGRASERVTAQRGGLVQDGDAVVRDRHGERAEGTRDDAFLAVRGFHDPSHDCHEPSMRRQQPPVDGCGAGSPISVTSLLGVAGFS